MYLLVNINSYQASSFYKNVSTLYTVFFHIPFLASYLYCLGAFLKSFCIVLFSMNVPSLVQSVFY